MSRNWCITWNNYTEQDFKSLSEYKCTYSILGKEVGESGTPHIQGYMEFDGTKRLETLHNAFPKIHWEARKGNQEQAITYCRKEDKTPFESGKPKEQGKRCDLIAVAIAVTDKTFKSENFPEEYIKYQKGIEAYRVSLYKDRTDKPQCIWRFGKTGTNKTRKPYDTHIGNVYVKDGTKWWDGYTQQEAIIVDDFDGKWDFRNFLRFLDRYPYSGEYKGGSVKINSDYVYITCEFPPSHYWEGNALAQVMRRFSENGMILECYLDENDEPKERMITIADVSEVPLTNQSVSEVPLLCQSVSEVAGNTEPPKIKSSIIPEIVSGAGITRWLKPKSSINK